MESNMKASEASIPTYLCVIILVSMMKQRNANNNILRRYCVAPHRDEKTSPIRQRINWL
jgi:hypothetical protein